ncbi:MAG: dephospho-CoA kinase [Clostridia bacterium]|nr:dephospho-CoA kinase [Clostridia bacterium]
MKVIGITGPSGAGKSLLSEAFTKRNIPVIDADALYHSLLVPPSECLDAIKATFGERVIAPDGTLDRAALGAVVFSNKEKLALLNETVLSRVLVRIREVIASFGDQGAIAVAVDAPTLIESGFNLECDFVISVLAPKSDRVARIMARDSISRDKAELRINAQKDDDFYIAASDAVLNNGSSREQLLLESDGVIEKILATEVSDAQN